MIYLIGILEYIYNSLEQIVWITDYEIYTYYEERLYNNDNDDIYTVIYKRNGKMIIEHIKGGDPSYLFDKLGTITQLINHVNFKLDLLKESYVSECEELKEQLTELENYRNTIKELN